jgi:hypothetical protein
MKNTHGYEKQALELDTAGAPLSRRTLLKGTAGAVLVAASSGMKYGKTTPVTNFATADRNELPPDAKIPGLPILGYDTLGGTTPLYRPLGLASELDRNEYFHNLTVHAVLETDRGTGGTDDNAMCPLWVRGSRRLLTNGIDITDPKKPFVAQDRFPGGWLFYAAHLKKWICWKSVMLGMTSPSTEYPYGHYASPTAPPRTSKYFQDEYVAKAGQFRGIRSFDVTDPTKPIQLGEYSHKTGPFGHAHFWDGGRYMYLNDGWDESFREASSASGYGSGLNIVDVWDPANVKEVAKWWVPGMKFDEDEEYKKWPFAGNRMDWCQNHGAMFVPRRVEDGGKYGYCGMGAFGMFVMDLTDIKHPKPIGHVRHDMECGFGSIPHHTNMPIETREGYPTLLISSDEQCVSDGRGPWHPTYIIDVKDPRNPEIVGLFPKPIPPKEAPFACYEFSRGRFGTHQTMVWSPPGAPRTDITGVTHFSAGVRFYDIRDPRHPKEVAYFVPKRYGIFKENSDKDWVTWRREEVNAFIEWDRNLIWISDHAKLMCCSTPMLGKPILEPRKVERWTVDHVNRGWDDETPKSVYFGRSLSQMT